MHVLVTGGCGYIGTLLVRSLLDDGIDVTVVDTMWFGNFLAEHPHLRVVQADVRDIDDVPLAGVNAVIHLANVANDPCSELDSKLSWEVNVLASKLLVEKAVKCGVDQFVYASSGSVYGVKDEPRVTEELSLLPISDYNKTKMISERVLLSYQDEILVQCIRPATVCGYSPRMRLDLSVNMLTMQALDNGLITVFGGDQTRPNIHVQDMVRVYRHLLDKGDQVAGIYNAGFENLTIRQIAEQVTSEVPAEIKITASNDPRSYRLCSEKLERTGFEPRYGIADGIREVVEHYRAGELANEDRYYNIKTMQGLLVTAGS